MDDWKCPNAENDLKVNGKFNFVMAAKDGSASFDFEGKYTNIKEFSLIKYTINDNRTVKIEFISNPNGTKVIETFEMENTNPEHMQREGWQAILNNFKKYVEGKINIEDEKIGFITGDDIKWKRSTITV